MKKGWLLGMLMVVVLIICCIFLLPNKKESSVFISAQAYMKYNGFYYREVTFWIEKQNKSTERFVKIEYPQIEIEEQYLINPVNDKHPNTWEKQKQISLTKNLKEGKKYSVVTKSKNKMLLEINDFYLKLNDYVYENKE